MRKLKFFASLTGLPLLFSCSSHEIRVEFSDDSTPIVNGALQINAHAVETSQNIVIDNFIYDLNSINEKYEVNIPNEMNYYSHLDKKVYTWPVVGLGAGTGVTLMYPFYIRFNIPHLTAHDITLTINLGKKVEVLTISKEETYVFFNTTTNSAVNLKYKIVYNVDQDNAHLMSDDLGYIYKRNEDGSKGKLRPIDYGDRSDEAQSE